MARRGRFYFLVFSTERCSSVHTESSVCPAKPQLLGTNHLVPDPAFPTQGVGGARYGYTSPRRRDRLEPDRTLLLDLREVMTLGAKHGERGRGYSDIVALGCEARS